MHIGNIYKEERKPGFNSSFVFLILFISVWHYNGGGV